MGKVKEWVEMQNQLEEGETMSSENDVRRYIGTAQEERDPNITRIPKRQQLVDRIREYKQIIENAEEAVEEIDNMKFGEGDIVLHRDYGICIIDDICTKNEQMSILNDRTGQNTSTRGYRLIGRGLGIGGCWVDEDTVVPYSDSAKVLYGEKKKF